MSLIKRLLFMMLAFFNIYTSNSESYTTMHARNLSSNFSQMHLLSVYESMFDKLHCLAQCNKMYNCKTVKVETISEKLRCSIFDARPSYTEITEVPNDIDMYLKSGKTFEICIMTLSI